MTAGKFQPWQTTLYSPGKFLAENLNYAGVVTRVLQPVLPVFFAIQATEGHTFGSPRLYTS